MRMKLLGLVLANESTMPTIAATDFSAAMTADMKAMTVAVMYL